ncbi:hypothetical protein [Phenylobacterium sp.]|uniref:hypothetical protein n=1 Tax=Phenylobacterium sp. TaxID=1871053 RepID=UPI0030F480C1
MTREQQIDQEARDLWQALKGGTPPEGLRGSELLNVLVSGSDLPSYQRLHSPFLRESQISPPPQRV